MSEPRLFSARVCLSSASSQPNSRVFTPRSTKKVPTKLLISSFSPNPTTKSAINYSNETLPDSSRFTSETKHTFRSNDNTKTDVYLSEKEYLSQLILDDSIYHLPSQKITPVSSINDLKSYFDREEECPLEIDCVFRGFEDKRQTSAGFHPKDQNSPPLRDTKNFKVRPITGLSSERVQKFTAIKKELAPHAKKSQKDKGAPLHLMSYSFKKVPISQGPVLVVQGKQESAKNDEKIGSSNSRSESIRTTPTVLKVLPKKKDEKSLGGRNSNKFETNGMQSNKKTVPWTIKKDNLFMLASNSYNHVAE